jgi:hypothetical protein
VSALLLLLLLIKQQLASSACLLLDGGTPLSQVATHASTTCPVAHHCPPAGP